MRTFTKAEINAAEEAWARVWMGAAYQGVARDAVLAALEAADRDHKTLRELMLESTVSASGNEITIQCDDDACRDAILNVLLGNGRE